MGWRKYDLWKISIFITNMLFLFVLLMWASVPVANAHEGTAGLAAAGTVTVQATLTADATVTVLNKEQLTLQVKQLQNQLQNQNTWFANNSGALIAAFSALIVAIFGLYQWRGNRNDERKKEKDAQDKELNDREAERVRRETEQQRWLIDQAEKRFQAAVEGLSSEREGAKIGAAILLRTFLRPGYEQFYTQTFDLAVANLRIPRTSPLPAEDPDALHTPPQADPNTPLPLTTLSQALIMVFKESFPLAREELKKQLSKQNSQFNSQLLDASSIHLDNAYLRGADLEQAWMPAASVRNVDLSEANLRNANLRNANLCNTYLYMARLGGADLREADLTAIYGRRADLSGAVRREVT